jgi:chlorite dismutase
LIEYENVNYKMTSNVSSKEELRSIIANYLSIGDQEFEMEFFDNELNSWVRLNDLTQLKETETIRVSLTKGKIYL